MNLVVGCSLLYAVLGLEFFALHSQFALLLHDEVFRQFFCLFLKQAKQLLTLGLPGGFLLLHFFLST